MRILTGRIPWSQYGKCLPRSKRGTEVQDTPLPKFFYYMPMVFVLIGWIICVEVAVSPESHIAIKMISIAIWGACMFMIARFVFNGAHTTVQVMEKIKRSNDAFLAAEDAIKQNSLGMISDEECQRIISKCRLKAAEELSK